MSNKQQVYDELLYCWESSPDEHLAYTRLLNHVFEQPKSNLKHIPFASFRRVVAAPMMDDETLLNLVFHLVNRGRLLEVHYELIEDDNCYEITLEELGEAEQSGWLAHPETGEIVPSYKEQVFMYFKCSSYLSSLSGEGAR